MAWHSIVLQILYATLATLGFSLLFNNRLRTSLFASLAGGAGWLVYLLLVQQRVSVFESNLGTALVLGILCESLAAILHKPATLFVVSAIIPLVPGSFIYTTMAESMSGNYESALRAGMDTLLIAIAIATGLALSSPLILIYRRVRGPGA